MSTESDEERNAVQAENDAIALEVDFFVRKGMQQQLYQIILPLFDALLLVTPSDEHEELRKLAIDARGHDTREAPSKAESPREASAIRTLNNLIDATTQDKSLHAVCKVDGYLSDMSVEIHSPKLNKGKSVHVELRESTTYELSQVKRTYNLVKRAFSVLCAALRRSRVGQLSLQSLRQILEEVVPLLHSATHELEVAPPLSMARVMQFFQSPPLCLSGQLPPNEVYIELCVVQRSLRVRVAVIALQSSLLSDALKSKKRVLTPTKPSSNRATPNTTANRSSTRAPVKLSRDIASTTTWLEIVADHIVIAPCAPFRSTHSLLEVTLGQCQQTVAKLVSLSVAVDLQESCADPEEEEAVGSPRPNEGAIAKFSEPRDYMAMRQAMAKRQREQ